jgi:hypothetical protein
MSIMANSLDNLEVIKDSFDNTNFYHQTELSPVIDESPELNMSVISSKLDQHQQSLEELTGGFIEVVNILHGQQELNPREAIESLKQEVTLLGKGMIKIYQHLEKDNTGKEIKSGQQNLRKAIASLTSSTIEANQKKTTNNISYLDWKQIAIIITATAVTSSLCSLAVFQMASNWKTDQPQNPVEKSLKSKSKKSPK